VPDSCRSYINLLFECKRGMVSVIVREAYQAERERDKELQEAKTDRQLSLDWQECKGVPEERL
jgi:hypothetical protein